MSLATKYRPTKLSEIVGQKTVVKQLTKALAPGMNGKAAFMFVGPSGCGKTTLARIVADHFAGGQGGAQNIIEFDAATNSGADAVRDIVVKAHYKALGDSPNKTIIMDEVHRLSAAAWSSLLKPIEEPPSHVLWCLCTTEAGKIPDTIKTRCTTYVLKPVDELLILELLVKVIEAENLDTPVEILELIAESCAGSPRQALTYLELCAKVETLSQARELLRQADRMKGPVDLARMLLDRRKPSWADVTKCIAGMENIEAESVRIIITNYLGAVVMKAKSNDEAGRLLYILECFNTPYNTTDKLAPLLLSVGAALRVGQP